MLPPIYIRNDAKELLGVLDSKYLMRRLQFMDFAGGKTMNSRILASFESSSPGNSLVVGLFKGPRDRNVAFLVHREHSSGIRGRSTW